MDRILRLAFMLGFLLASAACAPALTAIPPVLPPTGAPPTAQPQPTSIAPTPAPTSAPNGLFFVRPQGDAGSLIAYDMGSGRVRFSLPPGMLSADRQHYMAAKTGADTQLLGFDLTSGVDTPITQLAGQWKLSGVSPTGRWAALTRIPSEGEKQAWTTGNDWKTDVLVVDTQTGKTAHQMGLRGNFAVDTLSAAGDALFVIQYLPPVNPDHYQVRLVDLPTETLQDGALVDKRAPDEVMAGQRWQAVAPTDGSWLFTLYLRTKNNTAFIHALNTENKFTLCFDLPTIKGNTLDQLRAYTLALSPSGQMIYAANPALGIVAEVDLNSYEASSVASSAPEASLQWTASPVNFSVADDRRLYFTSGKAVWTFDTTTRKVQSLSMLDSGIDGLALSADGGRLFVGRLDQPPMILGTTSGQAFTSQ
jgi:hypothetical protein